jgi:hypothetical protein
MNSRGFRSNELKGNQGFRKALAVSGTNVYAGGPFFSAAGKLSAYFGIGNSATAPAAFTVGISAVPGGGIVLNWSGQPSSLYQVLSTTNVSTFHPAWKSDLVRRRQHMLHERDWR